MTFIGTIKNTKTGDGTEGFIAFKYGFDDF